jgi:hypothetical protein
MYAATGIGYARSATMAGAVQNAAPPSAAILAGAGLALLLTAAGARPCRDGRSRGVARSLLIPETRQQPGDGH